MAYTKKTWIDGVTPIKASDLNSIESGIEENANNIDELNTPINIITNGEPVKTGRKIDGKDEYVKRISVKLGNNNVVSADTGITNATIIKYDGVHTNGNDYNSVPYPDNTENFKYELIVWFQGTNKIYIKTQSDRSTYTAYINIYFTYKN